MFVLGGCVLQRGMLLRCLVGGVANLAFRSSLQALRAETMVERFTARMHVFHIKFVCTIGRVAGAKSAWPENVQYGQFGLDLVNLKGYANLSDPAGGRSLRARVFVHDS